MIVWIAVPALAATFSVSEPVCTIAMQQTFRPAAPLLLTLRATPDSVLVGYYPRPGLLRRAIGVRDSVAVFGQVFDLVQADGSRVAALNGHRRAVLVWWRVNPGCGRYPPGPAVGADVKDLFLIAEAPDRNAPAGSSSSAVKGARLRPVAEWIAGTPTFDVEVGAWLYSPTIPRPRNAEFAALRMMSVGEYKELLALLPLQDGSDTEEEVAFERLLAWGSARPERWSMYPAFVHLCSASVSLSPVPLADPPCRPPIPRGSQP